MAYGLTKSLDLELGSSQYARITDASQTGLQFTTAMTLEAWVKIESAPSDSNLSIASKFENTSSQNQRSYWFRYMDAAGAKTLSLIVSDDGTNAESLSVSQTLTVGTWYHVAVTWLGSTSTAKFYVDGSQVGTDQTGAVTSLFNNDAPFAVGVINDDAPSNFFDGLVSLVRAWSVVRTEAEISANICNVFGTATTNMQGEWSLNDVYTDASGNGNTLSAINVPVFATDVPSTCAVSGPANLKTYNTNEKANIKTMNTNPLANVKTFDTNA